MKIIHLNGNPHQTEHENYFSLLESLEINIKSIILLLNGVVIKSGQYSETNISDGDKVELISLVGGG